MKIALVSLEIIIIVIMMIMIIIIVSVCDSRMTRQGSLCSCLAIILIGIIFVNIIVVNLDE